LENFVRAFIQVQFLLDNGHQNINADGNPDLGFDRVLGCTIKSLDPQMWLDPFEEEFHLPAAFVKLGNDQCRQRKVVGEENEALVVFGIAEGDPPNRSRIFKIRILSFVIIGIFAREEG